MSAEIVPIESLSVKPIIKRKKFNELDSVKKIAYIEDYYKSVTKAYINHGDVPDDTMSALEIVSGKLSNIIMGKVVMLGSVPAAFLASSFTGSDVPAFFGLVLLFGSSVELMVSALARFNMSSVAYSALFRRKQIGQVQKRLTLEDASEDRLEDSLNDIYNNLDVLANSIIKDFNKSNAHQSLKFKNGKFKIIDKGQRHLDIAKYVDADKNHDTAKEMAPKTCCALTENSS